MAALQPALDFVSALSAEHTRLVARDKALGHAILDAEETILKADKAIQEALSESGEVGRKLTALREMLTAYGQDPSKLPEQLQLPSPEITVEEPDDAVSDNDPQPEPVPLPLPPRVASPTEPTATVVQAVEHCGVRMLSSLVGRWTEARIALTRRDYPTSRPSRDLYLEVCALPGDPMPSLPAWQTFAISRLGLSRPKEEVPPPRETSPFHVNAVRQEPPPEEDVSQEDEVVVNLARHFSGDPVVATPASPAPASPQNLGAPDRLSRALTLPSERLVSDAPIPADVATIRTTADLWGVTFRDERDVHLVNEAARARGARPFKLVVDDTAEKKSFRCLRCKRKMTVDVPLCLRCHTAVTGRNHVATPKTTPLS